MASHSFSKPRRLTVGVAAALALAHSPWLDEAVVVASNKQSRSEKNVDAPCQWERCWHTKSDVRGATPRSTRALFLTLDSALGACYGRSGATGAETATQLREQLEHEERLFASKPASKALVFSDSGQWEFRDRVADQANRVQASSARKRISFICGEPPEGDRARLHAAGILSVFETAVRDNAASSGLDCSTEGKFDGISAFESHFAAHLQWFENFLRTGAILPEGPPLLTKEQLDFLHVRQAEVLVSATDNACLPPIAGFPVPRGIRKELDIDLYPLLEGLGVGGPRVNVRKFADEQREFARTQELHGGGKSLQVVVEELHWLPNFGVSITLRLLKRLLVLPEEETFLPQESAARTLPGENAAGNVSLLGPNSAVIATCTPKLEIGARVVIEGLVSVAGQKLNGREGTVAETEGKKAPEGRFGVRIDGEVVAIKTENLQLKASATPLTTERVFRDGRSAAERAAEEAQWLAMTAANVDDVSDIDQRAGEEAGGVVFAVRKAQTRELVAVIGGSIHMAPSGTARACVEQGTNRMAELINEKALSVEERNSREWPRSSLSVELMVESKFGSYEKMGIYRRLEKFIDFRMMGTEPRMMLHLHGSGVIRTFEALEPEACSIRLLQSCKYRAGRMVNPLIATNEDRTPFLKTVSRGLDLIPGLSKLVACRSRSKKFNKFLDDAGSLTATALIVREKFTPRALGYNRYMRERFHTEALFAALKDDGRDYLPVHVVGAAHVPCVIAELKKAFAAGLLPGLVLERVPDS